MSEETRNNTLKAAAECLLPLFSGPIARSASIVILLRLFNIGLGFITTLFLAHAMGAVGFGVFALGISIAFLFSLPSRLGLQQFLIKSLPGYTATNNCGEYKGAIVFALITAGAITVLVSAFAAISIISGLEPGPMRQASLLGIGIAPFITITYLAQSILQTRMKPLRAHAPEFLIVQSLFLAYILIIHLTSSLTPIPVLFCFGAAWGVAALISIYWTKKTWPLLADSGLPRIAWRDWAGLALAMTAASLFSILIGRIETVALAALSGPAEIGIYAIAMRFALLVTFSGFAISSGLGPALSRLHAEGDYLGIGRRLSLAARTNTMVAIIACIGIIGVTSFLIPLIGPDFIRSRNVVAVLTLGFFVQATMSRPYDALNMLGHINVAIPVSFAAIALYATLLVMLIPHYGALGAAIATAVSISVYALTLAYFFWKKTGLRCDVFSQLNLNTEEPAGKLGSKQ